MTENLNVLVGDEVAQPETAQQPPEWTVYLNSVPETGYTFTEFGLQKYHFRPVKDPDGRTTGKFEVFYQNLRLENPEWDTLSGLLSDAYVIARVEKLHEILSRQLGLTEPPAICGAPFSLVCDALTRSSIQMFEDDSARMAFEIVTGTDSNVLQNAQTKVHLNVINSYNGLRSISIDYNLTTIFGSGNNARTFRDYFLLCNHSHHLDHVSHSLGVVSTDLENLQQYYRSDVSILKNVTNGIQDIVDEIAKRFSKEPKQRFLALWESLPAQNRNLLFVLIFASTCLYEAYTSKQHIDLRSYIERIIHKAFVTNTL